MKALFIRLYLVFIASIILFTVTLLGLSVYQKHQVTQLMNKAAISSDVRMFFDVLPQPVEMDFLQALESQYQNHKKKSLCITRTDLTPVTCQQYELIQPWLADLEAGSRLVLDELTIFGPFVVNSTTGKVNLYIWRHKAKSNPFRVLAAVRKNTDITIVILAILVCVFPWLIISRQFSSPLVRLAEAVDAMQNDKFNYPISDQDLSRNDGIGDLARVLANVQSAMEKTQAANKDLVARITHELHTPLTRISLAVALISRKAPDAGVGDQLKSIEQDCHELTQLSNELIDLSRISSGRIEEDKQWLSLAELIQKEVADYQSLFAEKHLVLEQSYITKPRLALYKKAFQLLINNLLSNLYKYATPGSRASLTVTATVGFCSLVMINKSQRPDRLEDVFEPFVRTPGQHDSHGLGLSFVKQVCELHQGTVSAVYEEDQFKLTLILPLK